MKSKRYSEAQIMHCRQAIFTSSRGGILKQAGGSVPVSKFCREHGMSNAGFYKWWAKFGGMGAPMIIGDEGTGRGKSPPEAGDVCRACKHALPVNGITSAMKLKMAA